MGAAAAVMGAGGQNLPRRGCGSGSLLAEHDATTSSDSTTKVEVICKRWRGCRNGPKQAKGRRISERVLRVDGACVQSDFSSAKKGRILSCEQM